MNTHKILRTPLQSKRILLGVSGGIAAYKSPEIVRWLLSQGAEVRVAMTPSALKFIQPLTFQALTGHPTYSDWNLPTSTTAMDHIEQAHWADAILIAPASANCIARLAHGLADDILAAICLATHSPIALAPAMNSAMWQNPMTQSNLARLESLRDIQLFGPTQGALACGEVGPGRMLEPIELGKLLEALFIPRVLPGIHLVITAGPTREPIDSVRFISNYSSGRMGFAIARAAAEAGAEVTLISGPSSLPSPPKVRRLDVITADEMYQAVLSVLENHRVDVFISAAAIADYKLENPTTHKLKREGVSTLTLTLTRTPDIVKSVTSRSSSPYTVAFAAETDNLLANARKKLVDKQVNMVVANEVATPRNRGFDQEDNEVVLITAAGEYPLPRASKILLARQIISFLGEQLALPQTLGASVHPPQNKEQ